MTVVTSRIPVQSGGGMQVQDLTALVQRRVAESGLVAGTVTVFCPGSTAALTTVEYEPGLVRDLEELFERIAPQGRDYHHNQRWHDGNGHSHLRASLVGPSIVVPFVDGKLTLGTWQQIVFVDFDVPARSRQLVVQIVGE